MTVCFVFESKRAALRVLPFAVILAIALFVALQLVALVSLHQHHEGAHLHFPIKADGGRDATSGKNNVLFIYFFIYLFIYFFFFSFFFVNFIFLFYCKEQNFDGVYIPHNRTAYVTLIATADEGYVRAACCLVSSIRRFEAAAGNVDGDASAARHRVVMVTRAVPENLRTKLLHCGWTSLIDVEVR